LIRDLGQYVPRRAHKLVAPLLTMLFNGLHDRHQGRVFVLQIGAGTGETGLPLLPRFRDADWSGLLIEPHPQNFAKLEALHQTSDRVAILNLGISDVLANLPLYSLTPAADIRQRRVPRGRASLTRDRIATPGLPEDDIQATEVPVLRLETVLDELGIDSAQLLAINAGGHEAEVLQSFDLGALSPSLVMLHCPPGSDAETACLAHLTGAGFLPFHVGGWLAALAPGHLAVPLEDLLTFFHKGIGDPLDEDE
jgi:FkbM family methyltransferase